MVLIKTKLAMTKKTRLLCLVNVIKHNAHYLKQYNSIPYHPGSVIRGIEFQADLRY